MHEPPPDHAPHDAAGDHPPDEAHAHPHGHAGRADVRRARRDFLIDAAIEAEKETGRRERTDEEARHSLWMRLARLIGGWLLLLLGLAAIPLPGPGWLMVLLGLTLLPYRWTENLIREIRRRVPGIPEDGRIPTRTWVITGVVVALTTGASIWWGLRPEADGPARAEPAGAEGSTTGASGSSSDTTASPGPRLVVASTADPARLQLSGIYGAVAAHVTDGGSTVTSTADPCVALRDGSADLALLTEPETSACFGATAADPAALAADPGVKVFAPVVSGGTTFNVAVRTDAIAPDDEPAEVAIDAVSEHITSGAGVDGDTDDRAEELMRAVGVLE